MAAQQFDDDLWFIDAAAADDQSAVTKGLPIGSAADGQQPDPRLQGSDALFGEAAAHVGQIGGCGVGVFAEQFAVPCGVVFVAQAELTPALPDDAKPLALIQPLGGVATLDVQTQRGAHAGATIDECVEHCGTDAVAASVRPHRDRYLRQRVSVVESEQRRVVAERPDGPEETRVRGLTRANG